MECHRCQHREEIEAGRYARIPFEQTPCAQCELREVSLRTLAVDPERPVFVPGRDGVHYDLPSPAMADEAVARLPIDVMQELVARLLSLPQEVRDVVCWRFMGLTYPEIGEKQGITSAGAEARHERAMELFPELRQLFIRKTAKKQMRRRSVRDQGLDQRRSVTNGRGFSRLLEARARGAQVVEADGSL